MCVLHAHRKKTAKEAEPRKLADASCVIQLTQPQKCCNITKVVFGNVKYIIQERLTMVQSLILPMTVGSHWNLSVEQVR